MIKINLEKNKKYILTCSFGPDSMCLFDLLIKNKINFVVAHVNYHILSYANEDEQNLKNYCDSRNIKLYVSSVYFTKDLGNEEDWCRTYRYTFFENLAKELNIPNILIAHQQDDLVETYIMQKRRNSFVQYYGLKPFYTKNNTNYIRPLLNYRKSLLLKYCQENKIPYSIDYSNFDTKYKRNYIRNIEIPKLSNDEFQAIIKEIKTKNKNREKLCSSIKFDSSISFDFLDKQNSDNLKVEIFYLYLINRGFTFDVSKGAILDFLQKCKYKTGTFCETINNFIFDFSYGEIFVYKPKNISYLYNIYNGESCNNLIKINLKAHFFSSIQSNFFTIKPIDKKDFYNKNGFIYKINRCFINWKVPLYIRKIWPGLYNDKGELIYVPRYQKIPINNKDAPLIFNLQDLLNLFY